MVNWAIALGAGARSALKTYETLDELERAQRADERAERALQIQERASQRAETAFRQSQADRETTRRILAGLDVPDVAPADIPSAPAGERTATALNVQTPTGEPAETREAPTRGGALTTPAAAAQPATQPVVQPTSRSGRAPDLATAQQRLIAAGQLDAAAALGRIRSTQADIDLKAIQAKAAKAQLDEFERKVLHEDYVRQTESLLALADRLPTDDLADIDTSDPTVTAVIDAAKRAKASLPDGVGMDFEVKDGKIIGKTIDLETGKVIGEKEFTKYGELRRYIGLAGALREPVAAAKWEAANAIARRKAKMEELDMALKGEELLTKRDERRRAGEMHEVDLGKRKFDLYTSMQGEARAAETHELTVQEKELELLKKNREYRVQRAEDDALNIILEGMKDPGTYESQMRMAADQAAIYNTDWWIKKDVPTPDGGTETVYVNRLQEFIDRIVPLREVETTSSDGRPIRYTTEQAIQRYVANLPAFLSQAGGDPNVVHAILANEHDNTLGFRPGAYKKYVKPFIDQAIAQTQQQEALRQSQTQQPAASQPAASQPGASDVDPRFVERYRERVEALRRRDAEQRALREAEERKRQEEYNRAVQRQRDRILEQNRRMPWE